jgi:hypothetical protein
MISHHSQGDTYMVSLVIILMGIDGGDEIIKNLTSNSLVQYNQISKSTTIYIINVHTQSLDVGPLDGPRLVLKVNLVYFENPLLE